MGFGTGWFSEGTDQRGVEWVQRSKSGLVMRPIFAVMMGN